MKLANRIVVNLIWIIVFKSLGAALVGVILISRALKSEAFSRVENDLKVARLFLNDRIEELFIHSQLRASGIEDGMRLQREPDLSLMMREGIDSETSAFNDFLAQSAGVSLTKPESGFILIPIGILNQIGFDVSTIEQKTHGAQLSEYLQARKGHPEVQT